jgi:uncharacterized protein
MTRQSVHQPTMYQPAPTATDHRPGDLPIFFAATFALTWGLAAIALFAPDAIVTVTGRQFDTTNPAYFVAVYSPTIVGIAMIATRSGFAGLGELASRVFRWRVHPGFYVVVLGGWLGMDVLARLLQVAISGESTTSSGSPLWSLLLHGTPPTPIEFWFAAPLFLVATLVLDAGPVGEEIGWKGYALPRLLDSKRGPLFAAIVFGVIWGVWHAPAFLVSGTSQSESGMGFVWLFLGTTFTSVIMTWLYKRTNESILVAGILVHMMNNSVAAQLWAFVLVLSVPAALAGISLYRSGRRVTA